MKICKKCGVSKLETQFWKQKTCSDKLRPVCKDCCNKSRKSNPAAKAAYDKIYRKKFQFKKFASLYNLDEKEIVNKFETSDGLCEICKTPETSVTNCGQKTKRLSIDHCHTTGKLRGLLCRGCNTALGNFKDNIELLEKAIEYLKKSKL